MVDKVSIASVITAFDQLTAKFKTELMLEYKAQRITGDKYAEVYNALMAQAMQQAVGFVIQAQQGDANAELIAQRVITEKAQVQDKIEELKNVTDVEGIVQGSVGKQKSVYDAQIKGFKDKSIQDATKTMVDVWSVQRSTDSGISPTPENKLYDANIGSAITSLFNQVSIPVAATPIKAYVQMTKSDGSVPVGTTLKLVGHIGTVGKEIINISIKGTTSAVVNVPKPTVTNQAFEVDNISVSSLPNGELTCTMNVRNDDGSESVVTGTVTKA